MDTEKLMQKHPNVSRGEIEKIRKTNHFLNGWESTFLSSVKSLDMAREKVKKFGRQHVKAGPIVQVHSVHIIPCDKLIDQNKPLTVYGRIYVEYQDTTFGLISIHNLFSRKCDDAQVLGPSGGPLTLAGPDFSSALPSDEKTPLNNKTRLVVDVFMGEGIKLFAEKQLCFDYEDMTIDMEKIELDYVHCELGSIVLRYIVIPFAVYGYVDIDFIYKRLVGENIYQQPINVTGRIVARYGNNECTLFEKQYDNEFERVEQYDNEFERVKDDPCERRVINMRLSTSSVGVPAYSSLILDFDLSEFGTGRKILKETLELQVGNEVYIDNGDTFIVDDGILIWVRVGWLSVSPQGRVRRELDDDDDDEILYNDEQTDEASSSSNLSCPWFLHLPRPCLPTSSVEIFSVFIGRENYKPLQVYGSIQVVSDEYTFYVFKREAKDDAFGLPEHSKTLPLLDGPRLYSDGEDLEMKVDLKDVESRWYIKGYVKWEWRYIDDGSRWLNQQLCSVIQGNRDDAAQPGTNGFIPLSRSVVAVPQLSSLIIEANIGDGLSDELELSFREVEFCVSTMGTIQRKLIMEGNDYSIYIYVRWE
ncbi:hypothetical protein CASFOL_019796 [Castilleja foliolosa]|uniref:DUF6598 domain-containing protein n=1 Tax=Castilleja foliolosa TaxID=1961234 RepID=A0ABD3D0B9_9LAMI